MNVDTHVLLFEKEDCRPKAVDSAKISGARVIELIKFQRRLHGVGLNRWSGSDIIVLKALEIRRNSLSIPYFSELRCTSTDNIPVTLKDVSKYGFYV